MKTSEIKKLTLTQLEKELINFKKEQFNLRFQKVNSQITNPARIKYVRRVLAKILTFINQKKKEAKQ
jgi:large subunit ribosomal protein L29